MTTATDDPVKSTGHTALPDSYDMPATILVAEDEHLIAADLAASLQRLNFQVIGPAVNGRQAIEMAQQNRPDLALVDIRMPDMDGLEAAEQLFGQMQIPVIIVSAYSDAEYLDKATKIGVCGYLLKPVSIDMLRTNIAVAWAHYQQDRQLHEKVGELEVALENRRIIEKAKGILMKHLGLDEETALSRLRKKARDTRRKMVEVAKAVLENNETFET